MFNKFLEFVKVHFDFKFYGASWIALLVCLSIIPTSTAPINTSANKEGHGGPCPSHVCSAYPFALSMKRISIVAASAREASPFGTSVVSVQPLMMPFMTHQCIASSAQSLI